MGLGGWLFASVYDRMTAGTEACAPQLLDYANAGAGRRS